MLDLPEPDRSPLTKSPLDLVVFQIRFDPQKEVSTSSSGFGFQAALDKAAGDWRVEPIDIPAPINFTLTAAGVQQAATGDPSRGWRLTRTDGSYSIQLVPDSLSVETRRYDSWTAFRATCIDAIHALIDLSEPEIELRVGLRYVDRIKDSDATAPTSWAAKLQPPLRGLVGHATLGDAVLNQQQQLVLKLDDASECRFAHGTLQTPAGLEYILDYDLYRQIARPFNEEELLKTLDLFNTEALKLFQASLQPEAREALR